jgi:hypothetical protein
MISYRMWYEDRRDPTTHDYHRSVWEGWFLFWFIPILIKQVR